MRVIDVDKLKKCFPDYDINGKPTMLTGYGVKQIIDSNPILEVVPMDFHERCLDIEIKRRFEVEKKMLRWRSVKDELPQPGEVVLAFAEAKFESLIGGTYTLCHQLEHYDGKRSWAEPWQYPRTDFEITHWMPLPEPPKDEGDEV